jgi:hypothetical protein
VIAAEIDQVHVTFTMCKITFFNDPETHDTKPKTYNYFVSVLEAVWSKVNDSLINIMEINKIRHTLCNTAYVTRHYIGGNIIHTFSE